MRLFQNWNQYDELKKRKYYFLFFSLFFVIVSLICFWGFILNEKSFFWIGGGKDGLAQNYNCLIYFSNHLRTILENFFINHTFVIPQWDFAIGYGADIMTTMSIMTIGDIFNWPSIFVPEQYIHIYYHMMGFVRLYLAGMAFSFFCFRMKRRYSLTFIGAFIYMFCGYVLISLPRQVVFINPMIWLPLLLLGVERIFHNEKPYLYIFTIFIGIIGSFQYFYILCITVFIYAIVRFFCLFNNNYLKRIGHYLSKFLLYTLIGALIGSFIFIPVIIRFLGDARALGNIDISFFYPMSYYKLLPASFFSYQFPGGDWTFLTLSPIVFISTIFLLTSHWRKYIGLKILLLISVLFILTPLGGLLMNGFSFSSNRWIFVLSFLFSIIFVFIGPTFFNISKFQLLVCLALTIVYTGYCIYILGTRINYSFVSLFIICLSTITLGIFYFDNFKSRLKINFHMKLTILLVISVAGVIGNSFFINSKEYKNYTSEFLDYSASYETLNNTGIKEITKLSETDFYRYEDWNFSNQSFYNSGLNYGVGGPNYFFSLSNPYTQEFYKQLNIGDGSPLYLQGLDSRKILNSLASIKYISVADKLEKNIPKEGYKLVSSSNDNKLKLNIYENTNVLPIGYTYSDTISEMDFSKLNFIDKQNIMLDKIVLKSGKSYLEKTSDKIIDYTVVPDDSVLYTNGKITVNKKNSRIRLVLGENIESDELYVTFKALSFTSTKGGSYRSEKSKNSIEGKTYHRFWQPKKSSVVTVEGDTKKSFVLRSKEDIYFNSVKKEFSTNVFSPQKGDIIDIYFSDVGEYSFDKIEVQALEIKEFDKKTNALKEDILENVEITTNKVKGTIELDRNKILCLSIPYTDGWNLLVDGKKTELMQGNIMFIATSLEAGNHNIELSYQTPGLKLGGLLTVIGVMSLCCLYIYRKNNSK
ncbi:MAG: YfhO family protein [Coprobacillus sp.]